MASPVVDCYNAISNDSFVRNSACHLTSTNSRIGACALVAFVGVNKDNGTDLMIVQKIAIPGTI